VLAADNVNSLQVGSGAEAEFFQRIARQGYARGRPGVTQQGIYCFTAAGELLASDNTRDPNRMQRCLDTALARWETLSREQRGGAGGSARPNRRGEDFYPKNGLVLRMYARDLGKDRRSLADLENPWNSDMVWVSQAEMRQFLPREIGITAIQEWPASLVRRLARLHLLDCVLGQPTPFQDRHLEKAWLRTEITQANGGRISFQLTGETRAADGNRSLQTQLLGRGTYDQKQGRFTAFELLATGTRRGSTHRAPHIRDGAGSGAIGFAFLLAADSPVDRVAPAHFGAYGW
jgi:hypothetical protein